ncbi:hypothetical protein [Orientia tsutsugamushi]
MHYLNQFRKKSNIATSEIVRLAREIMLSDSKKIKISWKQY